MDDLDLNADLNAQDDDGLGWSTLADATAPERIHPGAMLLAGNTQAQAVVRVIAIDDDGQIHFTILPGSVAKNRHLLDRTVGLTCHDRRRPSASFYTFQSDGVVRSGSVGECSSAKVQLNATIWEAVVRVGK